MIRYLIACLATMTGALGLTAADPVFKPGEETTVDWAGLPNSITVYLPTDYSPEKKHPCIYYYHGTNGVPDTRLMRQLTNGKTYVIVGMEYHIRGKISLPKDEMTAYHATNLKTYKAIRKWLETRVAIDPSRVYMGGASKGGWITSLQGEKDMENLAGLIILMAGRHLSQEPVMNTKAFKGKRIFVGVGELDPNDLASHWARWYYTKLGAKVVLEEYPNMGHELSVDSGLLQDWLAVEGPLKSATEAQRATIDAWTMKRKVEIEGIEDVRERYHALALLLKNPKLKHTSLDTRNALVAVWKATTAKGTPGADELAAQKAYRALVAKEYRWWANQNNRPITKTQYKRNFRDLMAIDKAYKTIVADYPKTRYAVRAKTSAGRLEKPIANMTETMKTLDSVKTAARSGGAALGAGRER